VRKFRLAALAVTAAACVGALVSGVAAASQPSISFSGNSPLGLPLLSCASNPDVSSVSVVAGGAVAIRNLTGHDASIYINGSAASPLASNSEAPVSFPAGTWTVALKPSCLLNLNDAGAVTVHATPAPAGLVAAPATVAPVPPAPQPQVTPTPTKAAKATKSAKTKASPQPRSTTAAPAATPTAAGTSSSAPGLSGSSGTGTPGIPGIAGAAPSGPGTAGGSNNSGTAAGTSSTGTSATDTTTTAAGGTNDTNAVSIGPAQSLGTDSGGPNYLLVVLTLIGIIGVGTASLRAVLAQRSVRRILAA
jgi:hypothetical protein